MTILTALFPSTSFLLRWLVLLAVCSLTAVAWAKPQSAAAAGVQAVQAAPVQPTLFAASLQSFMPQPAPLMLRSASGQESLSLPVSPRLLIRRAVLHLVATSSVSLLAPRSQLQVRLGGQIIAQIALDPRLPQIQAQIDLPPVLLQPGYDTLTFAVAQHYTNECEDPSAPELWTQIDTAQSWIGLDATLRDLHPTLAALPDVFDPKLWGPQQLTVLAASGVNADVLRWGGLAAQAVALYLGYAPLQLRFRQLAAPAADAPAGAPLRLDTAQLPAGDAVLLGTRAELQPYLSAALAARITGPFLAIEPLGDTGRYVLIVSGQTAQQVDVALRALNLLDYPYPDAAAAVVRQIDLPRLPDDPGPRMVYPNQKVSFAQLGLKTETFAGLYGKQNLDFTLPADLFAPDNSMVHLKLRFAYGAGLREDSVLNILLNGRFQAAIALSARDGGYFRDYDVQIPLTSFKPGSNVLTFSASMMPLVTGRCIAINTENLRLTLFDDSRLELPNAARVTSLPNLDLLQRTGFPYTRKPFGAGSVFAIVRADAANAAAAWMLAAKLAQVQKLPLLDARWQIGTAGLAGADNAIVVGAAGELPRTLTEALPLRFGGVSVAPYPVAVAAAGPGELGPLDRLWRWLASHLRVSPEPAVPTTAWATQDGIGLGRQAALLQAALPGRSGGTLTVLSAAQGSTLLAQTDALIQPAVWSQLGGDLVLWQGQQHVAQQMVGPRYTVGQAGLSSRLGFLLSLHPWFWAVVIGVLSLLLAAVTLRLLMRFRHRHHARIKHNADDSTPLV
ncbi:cellulose biosynthesis cyclic di-GMP-binding regulatory protein BcsB [Thiomonas sp.]|uniref:cellulose biosynthesis cyclic di-GMP-binding regulatory protein BcsB n=1 Tax=Thiomonas sp. TaxID=2047785 RepID=UPI0026284156|nr:cellulose biosynthesis cyclic di-GMP-binding regulatory protein BcsB [Thiomonas sp.]